MRNVIVNSKCCGHPSAALPRNAPFGPTSCMFLVVDMRQYVTQDLSVWHVVLEGLAATAESHCVHPAMLRAVAALLTGTPGTTHALAGRNGLGEQKSSMSLSDNYRFIPDSNHDSLMSIPYNPAHGFPGETDTIGNSVAISEASEWTLSAGTRAVGGPSSALSRGTGAPSRRYVPGYADSLASGFSAAFSEASDWTLSGGNTRQIPGLRGVPSRRGQAGGFSPLPSPSTRSQLGQSNGITSGFTSRSLAASNWTLSGATGKLGAPSTRFSQGSRALDDGRSIAFTDGGSEWALSPRSAVVRDDVDVGHSASMYLHHSCFWLFMLAQMNVHSVF